MSAPVILRDGGSISGPCAVGRVHVSEPTHPGTVVVKDGPNVVITLSFAGPGTPEPVAIFNPPRAFTTGVSVVNTCGGIVHCYVQGPSGAGY